MCQITNKLGQGKPTMTPALGTTETEL